MIRLLHLMNGLLLIGLIGGSLYVYPELPDRIPMHFGGDGTADRWGDRTLLSWMAMPLIAVLMTALMVVVGMLLPRRPRWINMPDRDRLLQLPGHLQRWVIEGVSMMLYMTTFVTLCMFAVLQYGSWQTAVGGDGSSSIMTGIVLGLVALPIVAVSSLGVIQKRMNRAWQEHQSAAP